MPLLMNRCVNVQIELAKQIFCASKMLFRLTDEMNERSDR